jgi:uncharacterized protein (TIGR02391 family)
VTLITTVVQRFLNLEKPTSRRELLRKFKETDAINELQEQRFFYHVERDVYAPLPLAFHYSTDSHLLAWARHALEVALYTLQNLDQAYPEKINFTREEFFNHAAKIYEKTPDGAVLLLGLYLSTHFGVFSQWSGDSARHNIPTNFCLHEDIVTIDPSKAWDTHIQMHDVASDQIARLPVQALNPDDIDFSSIFNSRTNAVRPVGTYGYHPEISRVSERLLLEGNFRQAVLDAFIHVIATVKERTGLKNKQGVPYEGDDLMNRAFSPDNQTPPLKFNPFLTDTDKDEQRGIWNLFKGIVGLRNYKAHVVREFDDPHRAHEYLALASLLMRLLDIGMQNQAATSLPENLGKSSGQN